MHMDEGQEWRAGLTLDGTLSVCYMSVLELRRLCGKTRQSRLSIKKGDASLGSAVVLPLLPRVGRRAPSGSVGNRARSISSSSSSSRTGQRQAHGLCPFSSLAARVLRPLRGRRRPGLRARAGPRLCRRPGAPHARSPALVVRSGCDAELGSGRPRRDDYQPAQGRARGPGGVQVGPEAGAAAAAARTNRRREDARAGRGGGGAGWRGGWRGG